MSGFQLVNFAKRVFLTCLLIGLLMQIARSISPSMSIGPLSKPYLLVPAIAAAQVVNVSQPGQEPDPSQMVSEDLALYDKELMTCKGNFPSSSLCWFLIGKLDNNLPFHRLMGGCAARLDSSDLHVGLPLWIKSLNVQTGSPLPWRKRQRLFWDPKQRRERQYTLDHVWTFVMYQSQVNMSTYGLDVALKYDLSRHLDGQPLQFMMKDRSLSLLMAFMSC